MRILLLFVIVSSVACYVTAKAQDESEPRAAPNRGLLKRGLVGKGKPTTTTTVAPQEEGDYEEEGDYPAEGEAQEPSTEAPASSTEGKKLVAGGVRPFRSNTDLLEALKRRRAQAAEAKLNGQSNVGASQPQDYQSEAPVKANFNKKRFNTATRETRVDDAPAQSKSNKGRFGRPSKSIQEAEPEEQNEATTSPRTGRQFRRGGN